MANYLERLGLKTIINGDKIKVTIPTFRLDLEEEVDLIRGNRKAIWFSQYKNLSL